MKMKFGVLSILMLVVLAAVPALAHHSFAAEFDSNKSVKLVGTVTRVDWINPHARIYIDVKNAEGAVEHWECELGSPNTLMHKGWTRNSLKPGEQVTISGWLAKDGDKAANAREVTLADGRRIFAGSSNEDKEEK